MTDDEWADLGFHDVAELGGGWQSHTFSVTGGEDTLVVKLTKADLVDRRVLECKTAMVAHLAQVEPLAVGPVRVCGSLVHHHGEWLVTATQHVAGERLDQSVAAHGAVLGASLAGLHASMAQLPAVPLPRVAALATEAGGQWASEESDQLLHGDFATSNVILTTDGVRVVDFDDCGYGPVEYDIANSLYMVMFDSWVNGRPYAQNQEFRAAFTSAYAEAAGTEIAASDIDSLIRVRVVALKRWASNPATAPIGIRISPPEWIATLRRFVDEWETWTGTPNP